MRLIVAVLWSLAAMLWLPWFAIFVRLVLDVASGEGLLRSDYFIPAFVAVWPVRGWLAWDFLSWWPLVWLGTLALVYVGWRFFWWADDWIPSYKLPTVMLTILVPPVAPLLLYRDARRRFIQRNSRLEHEVDDARERIEDQESLSLMS